MEKKIIAVIEQLALKVTESNALVKDSTFIKSGHRNPGLNIKAEQMKLSWVI
ncbi:MAG: hypothetical protein R3C61_16085 [Bacteroidia bacterium]